ncbi:MAG: hypothetical protein JXA19_04855 [Anaerolineales bacterium]|nr:hypothetical protein [Anaerolineales bacterium]
MRIKPELLIKIAEDTVKNMTRRNSYIQGAYLHGSILTDVPLLGDTADIDLVVIHFSDFKREAIRLSDEVSLDIEYHPHKWYQSPREIRTRPWLGHTVYSCKALYDDYHLIDFVQAGVRSQFFQADNVYERANPFFMRARQYWLDHNLAIPVYNSQSVLIFMDAMENIANGLSSLVDSPLPERRFLQLFPNRLKELKRPELFIGFLDLAGFTGKTLDEIGVWLKSWGNAWDAIAEVKNLPAELSSFRKSYYLQGFTALMKGDIPLAACWPLLRTWTKAVSLLPKSSESYKIWKGTMASLGWEAGCMGDKLNALDGYLDSAEEVLDRWKTAHGLM